MPSFSRIVSGGVGIGGKDLETETIGIILRHIPTKESRKMGRELVGEKGC